MPVMQWTDADTPPPEYEMVLIVERYREYGIWQRRWYRGYYDHNRGEWRDVASMRAVTGTVTHWMSIQMPEDGAQ